MFGLVLDISRIVRGKKPNAQVGAMFIVFFFPKHEGFPS